MGIWLKRILYTLLTLLLLVCVLVFGISYAIQLPKVQNWLTAKVTQKLSDKLQTTVAVKNIKIDFLNHLNLEGAYIADKQQDTLLYAGQLQFKITDWFFIKKETPEITYIKLSDAIVNLKRTATDSVWNYDFIAAAFADTSNKNNALTETNVAEKKTEPFKFILKNVALNNVRFNSLDKWVGTDLTAKVGSLNLDVKNIDLQNKIIDLQKIDLQKIDFAYNDYDGGRPKQPKTPRDTNMFNPGWQVGLNNLLLQSVNFIYNANIQRAKPKGFDEQHIVANNFNAEIKNIQVLGDTINAKIVNLSGAERCGLLIKQLQADVLLNPKITSLKNLFLRTNNSVIGNKYEMMYNNFTDFQDYITKVKMNATFKNTRVDFKDIAFFGEEINNLPVKSAQLNTGSFYGTVADFKTTNLDVSTGKSSILGDLNMRGLPDINTTYIYLNARNLQTNGQEIIRYIPQARTPAVAWDKLYTINYKGIYKGYISDFYTDGVLKTNQGNVVNKLHLTFPNKKNVQPTYEGFFSTDNLLLGNIIKQSAIGVLSATGKIKGSGYDFENINANIDATVYKIQTPTYTYQNVRLNGVFAKKIFSGTIVSDDPNAGLNFNGVLDLSNPMTGFNLKSQVTNIDLRKLGITQDNITASAIMDLNFKGNNLDNFIGTAKMKNLKITKDGESVFLESIDIESKPNGANKFFSVKSSALDATINGKFKVADLPLAMQYYLSNYLPEYINRPKNINPQQFEFNLVTHEIDPLLKTFAPQFLGSNNLSVLGKLDMYKQDLQLLVSAPTFRYQNVNIENIALTSVGNYDSLVSNVSTGALIVDGKQILPSSIVYANVGHDTANVKVTTSGGTYNVNDAVIELRGFSKKNAFYANILPSSFYLRDKQWNLFSEPYIIYDHGKLQISKLTLENGLQKIVMHTSGDNHENVEAEIANIDLAEINAFINSIDATKSEIEGRANGTIVVNNFMKERALSGNISTTELLFNKDTLGSILGNITYDEKAKLLTVQNNSGVIFKGANSDVFGTINMAGAEPILDLHAKLNQTPLVLFEQFLSGFLVNTKGTANGLIDVTGPINTYNINGSIDIEKVKTHVVYLGTTYTIPFANIKVNNTIIDLGNFNIYDSLNNIAKVKGNLTHNRFADVRFNDVNLSSNPDPFLFLNTNENSEELYYGYVIARGSLTLNGAFDDINMELLVKTLKGTHLYLPIRADFDGKSYDFIQFKSATAATTQNVRKKNKLRLNMLVNATPDALLTVIVDPNTGESIEGRGEGFITMDIDLDKPPIFGGVYTLKNGVYNYNFRGFIPKQLKIDEGGTLSFDEAIGGNPLKAKLNITTRYGLRADIGKYIANGPGKVMQTDVVIKLTEEMLNPKFEFDIVQPENNEINSEEYRALADIKQNQQKLMEQIGSLLLLDRFNPPNSQTNISNTYNDLINQISGVVAPTLSNVLTNSFENLLGIKGYNFDLKYQNLGATNDNKSISQLKVNVNKSFLDDRLTFEYGPSFDFVKETGTSKAPDVTQDFLTNMKINYLFKNNLSVNAFRSQVYDNISNSNQNKNGFGFVYKRQFSTIKEMFFVGPTLPKESNLIADTLLKNGTN